MNNNNNLDTKGAILEGEGREVDTNREDKAFRSI